MVPLCFSVDAWFGWAEVRIEFNLCNVEQASSPPNDGSIPAGGCGKQRIMNVLRRGKWGRVRGQNKEDNRLSPPMCRVTADAHPEHPRFAFASPSAGWPRTARTPGGRGTGLATSCATFRELNPLPKCALRTSPSMMYRSGVLVSSCACLRTWYVSSQLQPCRGEQQ